MTRRFSAASRFRGSSVLGSDSSNVRRRPAVRLAAFTPDNPLPKPWPGVRSPTSTPAPFVTSPIRKVSPPNPVSPTRAAKPNCSRSRKAESSFSGDSLAGTSTAR